MQLRSYKYDVVDEVIKSVALVITLIFALIVSVLTITFFYWIMSHTTNIIQHNIKCKTITAELKIAAVGV